jgi:hypothetical protein
MKKILTGLLSFLKNAFSSKNIKYTLIIGIIILVAFNFRTCQKLKVEKLNHDRDIAIYENNIIAMHDSLKTYYDKELDRMVTEKTSLLISSVEDLQKYNKEMYAEFKSLKNMVAGIKSEVSVIIPTLTSEINKPSQDPNDSTRFNIPWSFYYSDPGLTQTLIGNTNIKVINNKPLDIRSTLDTNRFDIKLNYALTEDDNKYTVKAFSPSPLVRFTELDGAFTIDKVIPEAKKNNPWGFGPYAGIGVNSNIKGENLQFGYSFGVALTYNFFEGVNGKKKIKDLFKKTDK